MKKQMVYVACFVAGGFLLGVATASIVTKKRGGRL